MISAVFSFLILFLSLFCFHHHHYNAKSLPSSLENHAFEIRGVIASLPETLQSNHSGSDDCYRFEFDIKQSVPASLWKNPGRVRLCCCDPKKPLKVGDEWQFQIKLKKPHAYANPGSFNKERYFFLNRWVAEGRVLEHNHNSHINSPVYVHPLDRLRLLIQTSMFKHLDQNPFKGILTGLVIGTKEGITRAQWEVFRKTGTAHLMAISGLHLGLMLGFTIFVCSLFPRVFPARFFVLPIPILAAGCGILVTLIYACLAGFSIPTQRAFIMILFFMMGHILRRRFSVWRSFCLSLCLVLLWDPFSIFSPGFWLSFSAVGIIMYGMQNRLYVNSLWWRFGRTQHLVFIGLMPLTFLFFQKTSLTAPLANLIAIPWVGMAVVPFALLGGLLSPLSDSLSKLFLGIATQALKGVWIFLECCSECSFSQFELYTVSLPVFLMASFGILLLLAPRGLPAKYLGFIFLLPLFANHFKGVPLNALRLTILDVGQGLATVIETSNHVILFDTGPKIHDHHDMGEAVVVPFLKTFGHSNIDKIIISHGDSDHIGGMEAVLKNINVHEILSSDLDKINAQSQTVGQCYAGQRWHWDGVDFEMLHPSTLASKKRNDHSCVLKVSVGKQSVLLTGDIEATAEKILLSNYSEKLASKLLLVPHHGSKTSSTLEFIQAVKPQYAIVSAGYLNAFGHPRPEIVERYQKEGIIFLETAKTGAISFILENKSTINPPELYRHIF